MGGQKSFMEGYKDAWMEQNLDEWMDGQIQSLHKNAHQYKYRWAF